MHICPAKASAGSAPLDRAAGSLRGLFGLRWHAYAALRRTAAAAFLLAIAASPGHADPRAELAQARHDLHISEQVLARVSERVDIARSNPATAPQEKARLDDYLMRIRELVELNRERVRALEKTVTALPAGGTELSTRQPAMSSARTNAEDVAALEAKLGGSLADFDALLLEEARKAQGRAPTRASAAGLGAGTGGGANGSGANEAGRSDRKDNDTVSGRAPKTDPASSGTTPGSAGGRIGGGDPGVPGPTAATPPDVGDGSDDDIVARQIRRAAELETDPELKKKLWDEYRRYKGGTKG